MIIPKNKYEWHKIICGCDKEPDYCRKYISIKTLYKNSLVPQSQWFPKELTPCDCDVQTFSNLKYLKENITAATEDECSVVILSETCGNGKTSWAIDLLLTYLQENWENNGFKTLGLYINVNSFLMQSKAQISRPTQEYEEMKENMYNVDFLVLDDIAISNLSEYDRALLYDIIDYRCVRKLFTLYTANCLYNDVEQYLGKRLYSRVWENSVRLVLFGKDRRGDY